MLSHSGGIGCSSLSQTKAELGRHVEFQCLFSVVCWFNYWGRALIDDFFRAMKENKGVCETFPWGFKRTNKKSLLTKE
jgi:hypothetical protein